MRVLFVLRSTEHLPYHASTVRSLCAHGHVVTLLFSQRWSETSPSDAVNTCLGNVYDLRPGWTLSREGAWRGPVFSLRELRSYVSYVRRKGQSDYYRRRWQRYLPGLMSHSVDLPGASFIIGQRPTEAVLRRFEELVPPDRRITASLRETRPDVLVASPVNMRFSEEVEYVKAAKALGIPTVIPVYSWDNLTTKGLFHALPDVVLAWNPVQVDETIVVHDVPRDSIVVTGAPFFDKWFDSERVATDRSKFCERAGIAAGSPVVVYLGSSGNIARNESWVVSDIVRVLRSHHDEAMRGMRVVVRPHPANARNYAGVGGEGVRVWPANGALPRSAGSIAEFSDTLRLSVAAIGVNTTAMIDAVVVDKACIAMIRDEYGATQVRAERFRKLLEAGAVEEVRTGGGAWVWLSRSWVVGIGGGQCAGSSYSSSCDRGECSGMRGKWLRARSSWRRPGGVGERSTLRLTGERHETGSACAGDGGGVRDGRSTSGWAGSRGRGWSPWAIGRPGSSVDYGLGDGWGAVNGAEGIEGGRGSSGVDDLLGVS